LFIDNYDNFSWIAGNIIESIRQHVKDGYKKGLFKLKIVCPVCLDKHGKFHFEFERELPDIETMRKSIQSRELTYGKRLSTM
jgi:hypothetical protein